MRTMAFFEKRLPVWLAIISALITGAVVSAGWMVSAGRKLQVLEQIEAKMSQVDQHEIRIVRLETSEQLRSTHR